LIFAIDPEIPDVYQAWIKQVPAIANTESKMENGK
jgi:hypothetical protein